MAKMNPFNPPGATGNEAAKESPFAEPAITAPVQVPDRVPVEPPPPREIEAVPSSMWTVAGFLLLLLLLGLSGYSLFQQKQTNDGLLAKLADGDEHLAHSRQRTEEIEARLQAAESRVAELLAEADELKRANEAATSAQQSLESQMREALASKDITISELQGQLTLSILDRILFDSGQAVIKPEGQEVLRKLAAVLDQFPNRQIHVTGHTDNVPIHTAQFPSNWELSAARALAAVRFLVEEAGVNPTRLAAVANGEFQPVADNATPEGRAKNRRIAIVVLPEVFKSPEAPPGGPATDQSPTAVAPPEPLEP
jgi:chemotaxis protein MotB